MSRVGVWAASFALLAAILGSFWAQEAQAFRRRSFCGVSCYNYAPPCYDPPQQLVSFYAPVQKIVTSSIAPLITAVPTATVSYPAYATGGAYSYAAPRQQLTGYYGTQTQAQPAQIYNPPGFNADAFRAVLREELAKLCPPTNGTANSPSSQPPPANMPNPNGTPPLYLQESRNISPELAAAVLKAFTGKANCVSCHGGGGKLAGDFRLVWPEPNGGYRLVELPADKRWKVYGMSSTGAMPPAAAADANKAMEADNLPALLQWATQK